MYTKKPALKTKVNRCERCYTRTRKKKRREEQQSTEREVEDVMRSIDRGDGRIDDPPLVDVDVDVVVMNCFFLFFSPGGWVSRNYGDFSFFFYFLGDAPAEKEKATFSHGQQTWIT